MIVLDTTVLVYAKGAEHAFRDPCRKLIRTIAEGDVEATTTAEVIQEFAHIRARRRGRTDAAALGRDYAALLSPLLTIGQEDLRAGLDLFQNVETLGAFDAVLAAATIRADATALVSADVAFAEVTDIAHTVPDDDGVSALLGV